MFVGLCANCKHVQIIKNAKGSHFHLCMFSKIDPAFSKYPRLPVLACAGYEAKDEESKTFSQSSSPSPE